MTKIITIGDTHGTDHWKTIDPNEWDKMVFVGDYVDSFTISNPVIIKNLKDLIKLKKKHMGKVILLTGNHDAQYMFYPERRFLCTGFRQAMAFDLREVFNKNIKLFQNLYVEGKYIFSHGGLSTAWALKYVHSTDIEKIKEYCNDWSNNGIYSVGASSGGYDHPGPLWARPQDLIKSPLLNYFQVSGHTATEDIRTVKIDDNTSYTFCDVQETVSKKFYELEI